MTGLRFIRHLGRRSFLALLAGLLVAVGLTMPAAAKTFTWSHKGDAHNMDPYGVAETLTLSVLGNIYEGLVQRGKDLAIEPALAERWEIVEPTRWRFFLRKGVTFHDGSAFTADDVIFSWKRILSKGSDLKNFVSGIKDIKKIDSHTIEINTVGQRPIFTAEISFWYIMSKSWSEKHGTVEVGLYAEGKETYASRHTNGTGPFMLKSREPGVKTVLVAHPNWWGKKEHNISEAIFKPIKSAATRVAAFLSGELNMMYPVPLQDVKRINSTPGLNVLQGPELRSIFLGLDVFRDELLYSNVKGKNPLKDVRVRKALYQAIDIEAIKKKIMRGASSPTGLLVGRGINGFDEKLNERFPYDPTEAKKLLASAGYPNGFEIVLDCFNDRFVNDEAICTAIAAMWTRVGINTKINAQTKTKHVPKVKNLDTSIYMLGWTPNTYDMHNTYYNNVMTRFDKLKGEKPLPGQGQWNFGNYSNPRVDELMRKIEIEVDSTKRGEMVREIMKIHKEEVGHLPLHQQALAWGIQKNIDLVQLADNVFNLRWVNIK